MMIEKTLEEVQKDVLTWYCNKLDAMQINNEYDLTLYCSYAGRLFSLGVEKYMPTADKLLSEGPYCNLREQIFLDRIEQGIWDIQEQSGKELGISLTELQDMYCFFIHTTCSFSENVQNQFSQWVEDGQYADVDADTIDYINDYLDANPLPQSDILSAIACPMPKAMYALEGILSKYNNLQYQAEQQTDNSWSFSNGKRTFELVRKSVVDNVLYLDLYEVTEKGKVPAEGVTIRQDFLPAVKDAQNPLQWTIDYCPFPNVNLSSKKEEPLTVVFPAGCGTFKIPCKNTSGGNTSSVPRTPIFTELSISRNPMAMAAANKIRTESGTFAVDGLDVELVIAFDHMGHKALINVFSSPEKKEFSTLLDGWTILDEQQNLLATIADGFASIPLDKLGSKIALLDSNGKSYKLIHKN